MGKLQMPLTADASRYIISHLGDDVREQMKERGYSYEVRRVGCFIPPTTRGGKCSFSLVMEGSTDVIVDKLVEEELSKYVTPHNAIVHDWHCVFAGVIIKGMQLEDGRQAVVYVTPGEWIRLFPTVLSWPIFPFGKPVLAVSHYDRQLNELGWFDMELFPEHKVLDTMRF
jgi:hypothetical protein